MLPRGEAERAQLHRHHMRSLAVQILQQPPAFSSCCKHDLAAKHPERVDSGPGGVDSGPDGVDSGPDGVDSGPEGVDSGPDGVDAGT